MRSCHPIRRLGRTCIAFGALLALGACSAAGLPALNPAPRQAVAANSSAQKPLAPTPVRASVRPEPGLLLAFAQAPQKVTGLDGLIGRYAAVHGIPESLLRRVIQRESGYNPKARNGPYWGLMQIRHDTARTMGYSGSAAGLLDAETNLRYAGKYLRGAYMVGGYNEDRAMRLYASGYYYDAKRQGLLEETGLR